ncbi:MAG: tRNA (adenosine(37)-N6)-threonylcarbamoyltransferase complex ATPase subunit type 1 TsaE [Acidimicrobiales bacterium]|nr:tRNA (adenosine(37)-N6)-threonylcarbamoyltransferase complex ATPase subunit type 1 TsaE [Acidimicrobiales bacterium]
MKSPVLRAKTNSVDDTRRLAACVAELARPGDLILLAGELGAGKTAFVQGFGAALGVPDRITSPTFTLAAHYEGRVPLHHLDVYRLEQLAEVLDTGIPELLDEGGVTLVEWGDAILPALPPDYLEIRLLFGLADDDRTLDLVPVGHRWTSRIRAIRTALAPWLEEGGVPC